MPRTFAIAVAVLGGLYLSICALAFFAHRSMIYFPHAGRGNAAVPVAVLERGGARLLVSHTPRDGRRAVLYFGGNAEDVSYAVEELAGVFPEHAIHAPHYRGYGGSSGAPREAALVADALALFDRVHAAHPEVTVIGRSLGSGIAVQVAAQRPVARLVLVTPYDSLVALGRQQFPWLPAGLLMRERFESWRHAPRISAPVTVIAAEHDPIVPMDNTRRLVRHFRRAAPVIVIRGAGHNDISAFATYRDALRGAGADSPAVHVQRVERG